jgi:serine/threonine protein kinase/Flp pilus assembly protein TadD
MQIDESSWKKIGLLFDQLVDLNPSDRRQRLEELALDAPTRRWLAQLLAAHDSTDAYVIDQKLDDLTAVLIGSDAPAQDRVASALTGQRLGNWRVGDPIGYGATATVFHGERADGTYEQRVAIKLLQPGQDQSSHSARLEDEIRVLARLEHPGIARLIDGGLSEQGWPYLVMEYVDGARIDQWCADQDLDWRQRIALIIKVCEAVGFAHSKLVVHADIKPSNVLVNSEGEPKLVDFGIAGLLRDDTGQAGQGHSVLLRCSPAYAAPEQLQGQAVSTATDVFGIGALLYQLLVGAPIRNRQSLTMLLIDQVAPEPVLPPSQQADPVTPVHRLRGDIDAICLKALACDPGERYPSIEPLQQDLENHLEHLPVGARAPKRGYLLSRWLYRHRLGAGLASLLILSLLTGLSVSLRQTQLANESARKAEAVTEFLLTVFDADEPSDYTSPLQSTRRDLAVRAAGQLDLVLEQQPEARVELLLAIGRVLRKVGLTDQARSLLQQALDEFDEASVDDPDSLHVAVWFELGQIDSLEERMESAIEAFRRADERARTMAGSPVERPAILFQLGRALSASRQFEEALDVLDEAARLAGSYDRQRELLPRIRLLTALTLSRAGRTEAALRAGEEAVSGAREIFGPDHDRTASALSTVAGMLRIEGELDRAEAMLREAYEIGLRNYGQPDAAVANNLARLMATRGNLVEAEGMQAEALSLAEAYYGPQSAATARYRRNLGMIQMWRSDWPNALENLRQAVADHERASSADDHYQLFMLSELAWVELQAGQLDRVRETLPRLEQHLPMLGERYPRAAVWIHLLAAESDLLNQDGDSARGHIDALEAILSDKTEPVKLMNWEQVRIPYVSARMHSALGEDQSALAKQRESLNLARRLLGADHPLRLTIEQQLAAENRL